MNYSIEKKMLAPQPALVMRRTIQPDGIAQALSEMFPLVIGHALGSGAGIAGPPFARYLKMDGNEWIIEAGVAIAGAAPAAGAIVPETLPGGPAAVTIHSGRYDKLRDAHMAVHEWLKAESVEAAGPPRESYLTDPGQFPDPKDWKTEVLVPLKV